MIQIEKLTKSYRGGVHALRDVSLEIGTGMFGLIGPNGAGKTTLMRILCGLMRPTAGQVVAFGHEMKTAAGKRAAKANLGYLPQELGLYPNLNAWEFLDYMAILKGITDAKARRTQAAQLLEQVRLLDVAKRPLKTYSGGMQRRIGIAQALLGDPKLIIVDEPTAGLDPEERVRLRNLLSDLAKERTIILSTHIIEDISQSCRDLAVLRAGEVVFRGAPRDLIAQAEGKVWMLELQDERPDESLLIVSTLATADGVQYRVIGEHPAQSSVQPARPTLEDGYLCMMRDTDTLSVRQTGRAEGRQHPPVAV